MSDEGKGFERDELVDEPGISGARWWQAELAGASDLPDFEQMRRRQALTAMLGLGAAVASVGVAFVVARSPSGAPSSGGSASDDTEDRLYPALQMQRDYGWAFGAASEPLVFDGKREAPFDRNALDSLAADCAPTRLALAPFFVRTIFESVAATPTKTAEGDPQPFVPLKSVLSPIHTASMDLALLAGRGLADLFAHGHPTPGAALVIDLPGPEAVALAAGAATAFDPVFLFDNWPHPRGVVPAHRTLAALAYYQPLFGRLRRERSDKALPAFVLDRERLHPYVDEASQFDNRHLAKVPTAAMLEQLGVTKVLYVAPADALAKESDDLNDAFCAWAAAGVTVAMAFASDFSSPVPLPMPSNQVKPMDVMDAGIAVATADGGGSVKQLNPSDAGADDAAAIARPAAVSKGAASNAPLAWPAEGAALGVPPNALGWYGGAADTHPWFWTDYPWADPPREAPHPRRPNLPAAPRAYRPTPRASSFSGGGATVRTTPPGFGMMSIVVMRSSGHLLGARISRSGSWLRMGGGGGGGG